MSDQDPGPHANPPSELPEIEVALMRIKDLRKSLAQMNETVANLELTIIKIGAHATGK